MHAPGKVRDAIKGYLATVPEASVDQIAEAVAAKIGTVSRSSIRSYLNLNTPAVFQRLERGVYKLKASKP